MSQLVFELQIVCMCPWQAESVNRSESLSIDFWIKTFCSCLDLVRSMLKLEFADLFRLHNYMSIVFETIRTDRDPVSFFLLFSYSLIRVMLHFEAPLHAVK